MSLCTNRSLSEPDAECSGPPMQGQAIFEEGLKSHLTSHMYDLYAAWLQDCLAGQEASAKDDQSSRALIQQLLLSLCKRAHAAGET